jgi:hypothetical protein
MSDSSSAAVFVVPSASASRSSERASGVGDVLHVVVDVEFDDARAARAERRLHAAGDH